MVMFATLFILKQLVLWLREPVVLNELLLYLEGPGLRGSPVTKLSLDIFLLFSLQNVVEVFLVRYYGVR